MWANFERESIDSTGQLGQLHSETDTESVQQPDLSKKAYSVLVVSFK